MSWATSSLPHPRSSPMKDQAGTCSGRQRRLWPGAFQLAREFGFASWRNSAPSKRFGIDPNSHRAIHLDCLGVDRAKRYQAPLGYNR